MDEVFVPSNGVITVNLDHIPAEKTRLKGFSTNRYQTSHGKGRVSSLEKGRDSCFVIRVFVKTSEFALACASRLAIAVSRV